MRRLMRLLPALAVIGLMADARPASAQFTWVGPGIDWNTATNWSGGVVPNAPSAAVNFTGIALGNVNISSSVQAQSLTFSNPTGSYNLTSSAGVSLSSVSAITIAPGVTGQQTINFSKIASGSLLFPTGSNLTINNNSTAPGTTLVIGPTTVIGASGGGSGSVIVEGAGNTEISGSFATEGGNNVTGGLIKNGAGPLVLSEVGNASSGGTTVNGGTLQLGAGTAIPTGSNVTVGLGAQFNIGIWSNGSATAIGNLTLNGGTFRVPFGTGRYHLNQLTMTGGTVDITGTSSFSLQFDGTGAGISVNGLNNTWIGSGASRITNHTSDPLVITVNDNSYLDAGIILSGAGTNPNFTKAGSGVLRLSNTGNTANITGMPGGALMSNDLSTNIGFGAFGTLGTGTITLFGTNLFYDGASATSAKPISCRDVGGISVISANTNLTMSGQISETTAGSQFIAFGTGVPNTMSTLTLTGNNSYTGATIVGGYGNLAISSIGNAGAGGTPGPLGASSNSPDNLGLGFAGTGNLLLTGTDPTYATDRGVTLDDGGVVVQNAATNLIWNGPINGGRMTKLGDGTIKFAHPGN